MYTESIGTWNGWAEPARQDPLDHALACPKCGLSPSIRRENGMITLIHCGISTKKPVQKLTDAISTWNNLADPYQLTHNPPNDLGIEREFWIRVAGKIMDILAQLKAA